MEPDGAVLVAGRVNVDRLEQALEVPAGRRGRCRHGGRPGGRRFRPRARARASAWTTRGSPSRSSTPSTSASTACGSGASPPRPRPREGEERPAPGRRGHGRRRRCLLRRTPPRRRSRRRSLSCPPSPRACPPSPPPATSCARRRRRDPCRHLETLAVVEALDPDLVLPLGDNQYETGSENEYADMYNLSWGRLRAISRPVPGNHEYQDDFNAPRLLRLLQRPGRRHRHRGRARQGVLQLQPRGLALRRPQQQLRPPQRRLRVNSLQERWLREDLQANRRPCTLAYCPPSALQLRHQRQRRVPRSVVAGPLRIRRRRLPRRPRSPLRALRAAASGRRRPIPSTGPPVRGRAPAAAASRPSAPSCPTAKCRTPAASASSPCASVRPATSGSSWPRRGMPLADSGTGTCH